jgi:16S rRNA (uracil1498-N3)-methyltransferase
LRAGAPVLVFNGRDGEWHATLAGEAKRRLALVVAEQTRPQPPPGDLHYLFAPLKAARLDYMVQKAVEMGATRLQPVLMQHSQAERINLRRMRANAVEAAEQCGILDLPAIGEPVALAKAVAALEPSRLLVFCDEDAEVKDPVAALAAMAPPGGPLRGGRIPLAVLVGPEGGFAEHERALVMALPRVVRLSLGPRILRADTAAVAALALVQAAIGDWR